MNYPFSKDMLIWVSFCKRHIGIEIWTGYSDFLPQPYSNSNPLIAKNIEDIQTLFSVYFFPKLTIKTYLLKKVNLYIQSKCFQ